MVDADEIVPNISSIGSILTPLLSIYIIEFMLPFFERGAFLYLIITYCAFVKEIPSLIKMFKEY